MSLCGYLVVGFILLAVAERAPSDPGQLPGLAGTPTATVVVPQYVKLLDTDCIYPGKTGLGLLHSPTQLFTRTFRSLRPTRKKRIPSIASLQLTRQQGIPSIAPESRQFSPSQLLAYSRLFGFSQVRQGLEGEAAIWGWASGRPTASRQWPWSSPPLALPLLKAEAVPFLRLPVRSRT